MATPLTEAATFDAQVIVPEDGLDDESAASLVPAFQSLADRTLYLKTTYEAEVGRHRVYAASGTSGTVTIPYYAEHVYASGFGNPVSVGCVWQVATPPDGSADRRWVMKLVNFAGTAITVKDAGGSTLSTITQASATVRAITIAYNGSGWEVIDRAWYP